MTTKEEEEDEEKNKKKKNKTHTHTQRLGDNMTDWLTGKKVVFHRSFRGQKLQGHRCSLSKNDWLYDRHKVQ